MVCFAFMIAEIIGGLVSGSLAILTDAAHMASDVTGFLISIISIWISQKSATPSSSFGYHRAEVLGGLLSIFTIWVLVVYLIVEATNRMFNTDNI